MAYEAKLSCITLKASEAITAEKVAVKVVGNNTMAVAGADDIAVGVLQHPVVAGEAGRVAVGGISMVLAGETISAGAQVKAGADGKVVTGAGLGIALEKADKAGDIIAVLL